LRWKDNVSAKVTQPMRSVSKLKSDPADAVNVQNEKAASTPKRQDRNSIPSDGTK